MERRLDDEPETAARKLVAIAKAARAADRAEAEAWSCAWGQRRPGAAVPNYRLMPERPVRLAVGRMLPMQDTEKPAA
jgi:hypothetical protein